MKLEMAQVQAPSIPIELLGPNINSEKKLNVLMNFKFFQRNTPFSDFNHRLGILSLPLIVSLQLSFDSDEIVEMIEPICYLQRMSSPQRQL
jgi:hypothetical protein